MPGRTGDASGLCIWLFSSSRHKLRRGAMTKLLRLLFFCVVVLAIAGAAAVGLGIWHFGRDLPDYQQLADYEPPVTTRVYAGDGRLLAEHATERPADREQSAHYRRGLSGIERGHQPGQVREVARSARCR